MEIAKQRRLKYGTNALVLTLAVTAAVVLLYGLLDRYRVRWDLTEQKEFSVSDQTMQALNGLKHDVEITAFFRRGSTMDDALVRRKVSDLLQEYEARSPRISWKMVDPEVDVAPAVQYQITTDGTIVFQSGSNRKDVYRSQLFGYSKSFVAERLFTNAILKVARDRQDKICFLTGHGERSVHDVTPTGLNDIRNQLQKSNYAIDTFTLVTARKPPEDCALLVVFAPDRQLPPQDDESVRDWVKAGGKLLLAVEPDGPLPLPITSQYLGLESAPNLVIDPKSHFLLGPQYPAPVMQTHEMTRQLAGVVPVFATARGLGVKRVNGFDGTPVLKTSPQAWGETDPSREPSNLDPQDIKGPLTLMWAIRSAHPPAAQEAKPGESAAAASGSATGSQATAPGASSPLSIIVGDADFASNGWLKSPGNMDLFLNMIGWLVGDEYQVAIRPISPEFRNLTLTAGQSSFIFYFTQLIYPMGVLSIGGLLWYRRRRR